MYTILNYYFLLTTKTNDFSIYFTAKDTYDSKIERGLQNSRKHEHTLNNTKIILIYALFYFLYI